MIWRIVGILLIAVLLATLGLVGSVTWFLWHERTTAEATLRDAHVVILEVGLTAKNLREASEEWKKSSEKQSQYATRALGSVLETTASLQTLVKRTDASLNDLVLPSLAASVNEQNQSLLQTQVGIREELLEMNKATIQAQEVLRTANEQLANPAIAETLQHSDDATKNIADVTGHLSNMTASGERVITYYEKKLTTPVGFVKTLAGWIVENGYKLRAFLP